MKLYENEIKRTEDMVKKLFLSVFNDTKDDKALNALDEKINKWKKSTFRYIEENNPFDKNEVELAVSEHEIENNKTTKEAVISDLSNYKLLDENINISFWIKKLSELDDKLYSYKEVQEQLNIIRKNEMTVWKNTYDEKLNIWQINTVKERRDKFIDSINEWIKLIKKLHGISNFLRIKKGVLWDFRVGELLEEDISMLFKWASFINRNNDITKICEKIGRRIEEYNSKNITNINSITTYNINNPKITSKDEIVGITFSKDIENIIPEELLLLSDKNTEVLFKLKYIESRLMCFDKSVYIFNNKDMKRDISYREKSGLGPVIICIDTSGSMKGDFENIAKAFMLKIVTLAIDENRDCYLINFSTEIHTLKFTQENAIEELIGFLKFSFYGGSDVYKAMLEAIKIMNTEYFKRADLLVISDFIMDDLPKNIIELCKKQKTNKNRFFAVSIGSFPFTRTYEAIFDIHWSYDIQKGAIRLS